MAKVNPILKKDLKVTSRSAKLCLELTVYEAILMLIFIIQMNIMSYDRGYYVSYGNRYDEFVNLFPILSIVQIVIVGLIIPIMTASSISGERERQTFDIMLTTSMTPFSIILGKVTSAVIRVLLFVVASIPIMSLSFLLGGMSWLILLYFLIAITVYAFFSGSIGILCSSICKKSISSIILAYVINFAVYVLSFVPMFFRAMTTRTYDLGESPLLLLLNPVVFFEEFYCWIITGRMDNSLMNELTGSHVGTVTNWFTHDARWLIASGIMIILLTLVFMLLSARRINPLKGRSFEPKRKAK